MLIMRLRKGIKGPVSPEFQLVEFLNSNRIVVFPQIKFSFQYYSPIIEAMSNGKNQTSKLVNALYSLRFSQELKRSFSCSHLVFGDLGTGCILSNSFGQPLVPQASLQASSSSLINRDLGTRVSRRIRTTGAHGPLDCETLNI